MMTTAIHWYIQLAIYICKGMAAGAGWGTWGNPLSMQAAVGLAGWIDSQQAEGGAVRGWE